MSIKLLHAALDEEGPELVLRGVIDPASLAALQVAEYQREVLTPRRSVTSIMDGLQSGSVPDIQLGCRGGNYTEREGNFYVQDPVYIIDGLQRVTAAKTLMARGTMPRLGGVIHFNTTEAMERERFRILNMTPIRLSPSVLLRNARHDSQAVAALYQLCFSSQFILNRRVCWNQRMKREDLITALTFLFAVSTLHGRFGAGMTNRSKTRVIYSLDKVYALIGRAALLGNTRELFATLDAAFNLRDIAFRDISITIRTGFLMSIARVFATHEDFWNGHEFSVPPELVKKLASFPVKDPQIVAFASSTGKSTRILADLIVQHLNSGKRTKRLRPSVIVDDCDAEEEIASEEVTL